ncbi:hypothetical protein EES46_24910 [Streptomyces sp. ADI98-10]|nr:hypothetical protein EES46_24910 [Streptomyces sp. ADI98-10]
MVERSLPRKSSNCWISCGEYADIASAIRSVYGPKNASARGRMPGLLRRVTTRRSVLSQGDLPEGGGLGGALAAAGCFLLAAAFFAIWVYGLVALLG